MTPPLATARSLGRWRGAAVLASLGVLVGCLLPGHVAPPTGAAGLDKVVHVLAFALLGFAWRRAGLRPVTVLAVGVGLALLAEGGQALIGQGRSADPWDGLADLFGTGLGLLAARVGSRP